MNDAQGCLFLYFLFTKAEQKGQGNIQPLPYGKCFSSALMSPPMYFTRSLAYLSVIFINDLVFSLYSPMGYTYYTSIYAFSQPTVAINALTKSKNMSRITLSRVQGKLYFSDNLEMYKMLNNYTYGKASSAFSLDAS